LLPSKYTKELCRRRDSNHPTRPPFTMEGGEPDSAARVEEGSEWGREADMIIWAMSRYCCCWLMAGRK
jgi:hypothetical protein